MMFYRTQKCCESSGFDKLGDNFGFNVRENFFTMGIATDEVLRILARSMFSDFVFSQNRRYCVGGFGSTTSRTAGRYGRFSPFFLNNTSCPLCAIYGSTAWVLGKLPS
jgi:hypothetical protein